MVNSPGFNSEETLARRCLDRLKENNPHINPKELDRLFTKTMKSTSFNALSRSLPGIFNQEYLLQNSGVDLETYEYSTRNGGLFILTNDTYAYVDPNTNGAQKTGENEIKSMERL